MEILGIVVFALGILVSVALHEAGHMVSAKAFGMKVTRFFIGFGPTLFSFRKGDTEYGFKPIPLGAFVKIVGMTPQDDDVAPGDEKRAMWRFPVWKRTIVMSAGSMAHFALGFALMWGVFAFAPHADEAKTNAAAPVVADVLPCVTPTYTVDSTGNPVTCQVGKDPQSPAKMIGLQAGDKILAINGKPVPSWSTMTDLVRGAGATQVTITYERAGTVLTSPPVVIPLVQRPRLDLDPTTTPSQVTPADLERVGQLGITQTTVRVTAGPLGAFGMAKDTTAAMFKGTFASLKLFPEKVPRLWAAITGAPRDPQTPVSMIGASRIGGQLFDQGNIPSFLLLLASLNFFVGIFNLLPLLPLDGGHIAIAWFERVRSWLYARLGRAEPGRVDYLKLMPVTYVVILVFGGFTLLTIAADIVNPITIPK